MSWTADSIAAGVVSQCAHCRELAADTVPAGDRADVLGVDPAECVCAVCAGAAEVAPPLPWHLCWDEADALSVPADVATPERCAVVPVTTDRDDDLRAIEARVRTAFKAAGWGRGDRCVVALLRWRSGRGGCEDDYVCHVAEWTAERSPRGSRVVQTRVMQGAGATALEAAGAVVTMVGGATVAR